MTKTCRNKCDPAKKAGKGKKIKFAYVLCNRVEEASIKGVTEAECVVCAKKKVDEIVKTLNEEGEKWAISRLLDARWATGRFFD